MLLYGEIVKKALEQEALPILKDVVDTSLTERFGEEWYAYFARAIMEGYGEFKQIDAFVNGNKGKAIDAFDVSAICYLVMPYDKDLKMYLDGAMPMIEEKYGLERNPERLKRLRSIQNNVSRNKLDVDMPEDEETALQGVQEKKWLQDMEDTLKELKPECSLAEYFEQLEKAVNEKAAQKQQQEEALTKRPSYQEVRDAYTKIRAFDFSDAPVAVPLLGNAPWIGTNDDLESLPWPSTSGKEEPKKATEGMTITPEMLRVMMQSAAMTRNAGAPNAAAMNAGMPGAGMPNAAMNAGMPNAAMNAGMPNAAVGGGMPGQAAPAEAIDLSEFIKPDPAGAPVRKVPGTAPNEDADKKAEIPSGEGVTETASAESAAAEQKGKGIFGWFKGKK